MVDPNTQGPLISAGVLSWLKIVSFCVTSALAVIGLQGDFKNKRTHRLTFWGRANLCGIVIAFVVGLAAQVKEDVDKRRADDELKEKLSTIITTNSGLMTKTTDALDQLKTVVKDNGTLIGNTSRTLISATTTEHQTELALQDAERSMQLIGSAVNVSYEYVHPLADLDQAELNRDVGEFVDSYRKKNPVSSLDKRCEFKTDEEIFNEDTGKCHVMFGAKSSLIPQHPGGIGLYATSPPFSLDILESKPPLPKNSGESYAQRNTKPPKVIASYSYDIDYNQSVDFSRSSVIKSRPLMFYTMDSSYVGVSSDVFARFNQNDLFAPVLSVIDLGGKYLRITQRNDVASICAVTLQLGPRYFRVPMGDAERDYIGNYVYKFPKDMKQTGDDLSRARTAEGACMHPSGDQQQ